ncbi:MAG: excinuclease ABC subunit UvrA [Bacteroidales bacterium]|jgi:excinuclease ABC subunit A|nr:excinuclease ABC subunit UvrA [Bacteroidales bacterium]MDD4213493.1 excinuclease ABC subunit UvrA [Bacteroidales bacterium]
MEVWQQNDNVVKEPDLENESELCVYGARVHNLRNVDVVIPRNKLVVITGLSGSGKSSLAFDTIYAEGQRRYLETFSNYIRQFIGNIERPDVDKITGLSPVIAIEQKSSNRNPRSTVGTITEIYDFLRLLFARTADAYSFITGEKMVRYSEQQIISKISDDYLNKNIFLLAPKIKGRKGHYRELFEQIRKLGFVKVRVDGIIKDLTQGMQLDRYKMHDIEIVIDNIIVKRGNETRLSNSVQAALKIGRNSLVVYEPVMNEAKHLSRMLMCPASGISYDEPEPNSFSFNSPYGACPKCTGLGEILEADINKIIPDYSKSIRSGGIAPVGVYKSSWIFHQLEAIGKSYDFTLDTPLRDFSEKAINIILYGTDELYTVKNEYLGVTSPYKMNFEGVVNFIINQNSDSSSKAIKKWAGSFMNKIICPECHGARLKKESLHFRVNNKNISELANFDLLALSQWLNQLNLSLDPLKYKIANEIVREIQDRLIFLLELGLDYLTLNRAAASLSGGESQRIRLATQISSQLVNVLYVLDEPSIGLHQRDNHKLISALKELRDIGNSIIVVEHDRDMIFSADYVIDIGPGGGVNGGKIVTYGDIETIIKTESLTSQYLNGKKDIKIPLQRRKGSGNELKIIGAKGNNLKELTVSFPLETFICITGVSGSGKSSLINQTLYPALSRYFYRSEKKSLEYEKIEGLKFIDKVVEIDQSPIGRTPRSNPATYTGVFDEIRKLFVQLPEAKIRGYLPGRFSFNVKGGRCETCGGAGMKLIEMNFLPDVFVPCEACNGKRYSRETLEIKYKGKSISDVLDMNIDEAVEFFLHIPSILNKIKTLKDVGLGYIKLGQQSTTLSGGEAQRVKLATELSKKDTGRTLYILDEPTTGLHFEDTNVLLEVLQILVNKGNTVIVIEHNMDVIKVADYIIDLGPEGGDRGGMVVCEGTPESIIKCKQSYTAKFLKQVLVNNKNKSNQL